MSEELERLDKLLAQLGQLLDVPGDDGEASPEWTWQKLGVMADSMGPEALGALLRRQGMGQQSVDEALQVLSDRQAAGS